MNKTVNCIKYPLTLPAIWYQNLQSQGLGQVEETRFIFDKHIGDGQLSFLEFQHGFWGQQMDFTLAQNLHLRQEAVPHNNLFIINFYLTNTVVKQRSDDTEYNLHLDRLNVMLSSSSGEVQCDILAHDVVKIVQIGFTREWLVTNAFHVEDSPLKKMFMADIPIYFCEALNYKFKHLLDEVDIKSSNKLFLFSTALQLLDDFFSKLEHRKVDGDRRGNIHPQDMEHLIAVQNMMDSNPLKNFGLDELAQKAHMSVSKFKRLFKEVFGQTPYNHYLRNRLEIAMNMLRDEDYSISEVGHLIGYSNLSHFASAFKKHFGLNPSDVRGME